MKYEKDFANNNKPESIFNPAPRNCYLEFYGRTTTGYATNHHSKKVLLRLKTTNNNVFKKGLLIQQLYVRICLQYPNQIITFSGILFTDQQKAKNKAKIEITTAKRMITKYTNAIASYEEKQNTLLIPNFDNPRYLKSKKTLQNYREKLVSLQNKTL